MKKRYVTLIAVMSMLVLLSQCSSEAERPNGEERKTFYDAIRVGNLEEVQRRVEANLVYLSCGLTTSDFFAAQYGQEAIYMYLFDKISEHYHKGHKRTVDYIEQQNIAAEGHPFIDRYLDAGETALHLAVRGGFIKFAKLLLEQGASVNASTEFHPGERPIEQALAGVNYGMVKLFVSAGADICYEPYPATRITLLQRAINNQRGDIVQYLVRHGALTRDGDDRAISMSFAGTNMAREQEVVSKAVQESQYGALLPIVLNQLILGFLSPFLRMPDHEAWKTSGYDEREVWQYRRPLEERVFSRYPW